MGKLKIYLHLLKNRGRIAIMGKKKQNSVTAVSKAKKDFKQRLATANVSNKVTKATNKFKSTKPVLKNLKKIVNEIGEETGFVRNFEDGKGGRIGDGYGRRPGSIFQLLSHGLEKLKVLLSYALI